MAEIAQRGHSRSSRNSKTKAMDQGYYGHVGAEIAGHRASLQTPLLSIDFTPFDVPFISSPSSYGPSPSSNFGSATKNTHYNNNNHNNPISQYQPITPLSPEFTLTPSFDLNTRPFTTTKTLHHHGPAWITTTNVPFPSHPSSPTRHPLNPFIKLSQNFLVELLPSNPSPLKLHPPQKRPKESLTEKPQSWEKLRDSPKTSNTLHGLSRNSWHYVGAGIVIVRKMVGRAIFRHLRIGLCVVLTRKTLSSISRRC
ncbi:hypothetical protein BC829DRAFT_112573 [Chytridium lagenaria]|nr:hypothetical protein BC829DRAFT_112573 [Chytridium lagenaria]